MMEPAHPPHAGEWTESALRVLRERYLIRRADGTQETPEDMCWRVASHIAGAETRYGRTPAQVRETAHRFYDQMVARKFVPNSPTLMNAGKDNSLQYSACYVLPVDDSLEGIFDAIKRAALIHQSGGGTGFSFSRLRSKNSRVGSTGGRASGPVSFLRVFNAATEAVKQGGTRRGANMGILQVDHPDILEFIECKLDGGITNFNISVAATDAFMEALEKGADYDLIEPHTKQVTGRLSAREVFQRVVDAAWRTGDPGLVFIDRINASPANPTPEVGRVEATNPCVTGDTLVSTDRGLVRMETLAARYAAGGIAVRVDERLFPERFLVREGTHDIPITSYQQGCLPISQAFRTGERETVRVRTRAGYEVTCTLDHRFMTERGWVEAKDLVVGEDKLFIQSGAGAFSSDTTLPVTPATDFRGANGRTTRHALPQRWSRELGVVLGWLVGDGWLRAGDRNCRVGFTFGSGDGAMLETIQGWTDAWYGKPVRVAVRARGVKHLSYHGRYFVDFFRSLGVEAVGAAEKKVPESLYTAPREAVVGFLQGLFTADGTVRDNPKSGSSWVCLTSKSRELLQGVQVLLVQLGLRSTIFNRSRPARTGLFRCVDKAGMERSYGSDGICFELGVMGESREKFLREIGFLNEKQTRLENVRYAGRARDTRWVDEVESVTSEGVREVFDLTEPQSHSMINNGIVLHQCGEQPLLPNEACNLGSLNLSMFVKRGAKGATLDWQALDECVRASVRFLDDVIEMNPYPLPEIDKSVKDNRRIGLGVMGVADVFLQLGIPYDSEAALHLAEEIMSFIQRVGHEASEELALERGPFPNWERSIYKHGKPLRNSTVTTIAPTGTISIIAGCSSGIEPLFALAYSHIVGDRHLTFVNPIFEEVAKAKGILSAELMERVARHGSAHGLAGVPEELQRVFVTAHEVAPEWHVRMQSAFQKHTDNGVSKTINLPNAAAPEDIARAYLLAWETGCLGITVFRDGCKGQQVLHVGTAPDQSLVSGATEKEGQVPVAHGPAGVTHALKPRPAVAAGATYRTRTPLGTAFLTVNRNGSEEPLEVFVMVGKAGSETQAVAEAIGRLISLVLRLPSSLSASERMKEVVDQLIGIGGGHSMGFGPDRVRSLPDAVAQVLGTHLGLTHTRMVSHAAPMEAALTATATATLEADRRAGDLCPSCGQATFVYEEGCQKCHYCGHSEC